MVNYSKHFSTTKTPQSEAIPGREADMTKNSAGGFSFALDKWAMLRRFLILGSEGGSYYATERALTQTNAKSVIECVKEDGLRVVNQIVEISDGGKASKNDPALFALAICFDPTHANEATRKAAAVALSKVARIPTHLFHFAENVKNFRGWGRALRRAVGKWYLETPLDRLAMHAVKYKQRDGWSNADLLRLSHPKTVDPARNAVFKYIVDDIVPDVSGDAPDTVFKPLSLIRAAESLKELSKDAEIVQLITSHKLPMEVVPTDKRSAKVYHSVMQNSGMEWLVRNLGNLGKQGILAKGNFSDVQFVCDRLTDKEAIRKSRLHPIKILAALMTYKAGRGVKGDNTWTVVPDIVDALDDAFYKSFENVEPSNKRILWGMDISGSMWGGGFVAGVPGLHPALAQGALAMVTYKTEKRFLPMAFTTDFIEMELARKSTLDAVVAYMQELSRRMGGTDCALPMLYALKNKIDIDTFIVSTDNETWAGAVHPVQALRQYREKTGIPARLIVVGMVANNFSIADPKDAGMLDVVGFSTDTPAIMSAFGRGEL